MQANPSMFFKRQSPSHTSTYSVKPSYAMNGPSSTSVLRTATTTPAAASCSSTYTFTVPSCYHLRPHLLLLGCALCLFCGGLRLLAHLLAVPAGQPQQNAGLVKRGVN
jgi:hypothetical protein